MGYAFASRYKGVPGPLYTPRFIRQLNYPAKLLNQATLSANSWAVEFFPCQNVGQTMGSATMGIEWERRIDPEDPLLRAIHDKRLVQRDIDQLLGVCEFALQDGMIDEAEARAILQWLNSHSGSLHAWPANVLYTRLRGMLSDGMLDDQEQGDLLGLVMSIARPRDDSGVLAPTALPLDAPAPRVTFPSRTFCFTGVFDFGPRALCQSAVVERGGASLPGVSRKLNYLVIGNVGSEVWRHTSFGGKIVKAVEYRDSGVPLAIISESHWVAHLT